VTQIAPARRYLSVEDVLAPRLLNAARVAPTRTLSSDAAFEAMYAAAWPRLCRYAWVLVRHQEDAEDVAAETVRRAYGAWRAGRGPVGDPLAWLFLIARRIVIDRRRRPVLGWLSLSGAGDPPSSTDSLGRAEAAVWFDQLRECMSRRQHEAIVLRFLFDFDDVEIGRIMGLSPAGVRTNVSRGVAALRKRPEVFDR
jgi:RNA polymerase sigma factor (sigma-70 family)